MWGRRCVVGLLLLGLLGGCSDDVERETLAWVRIDTPAEGTHTTGDSILVTGNAAMRNGSYPSESIYWYNGGASGVATSNVVCILACIAAFQATVPLYPGENRISVQLVDGTDSVTVHRD